MNVSKQTITALILVLLTILTCIPVLLTPHVPLADYPNHLARVQVWNGFLHGVTVPHLEPVLALQPNMAFDLVVLGLTQFMDIETSGKIFILLTIVSVIWGPAILSKKNKLKFVAIEFSTYFIFI